MPNYEFFCQDCKKPFSRFLTIAAHDKDKIVCPACGSANVKQQLSPFYAVTSKKSA
jgi:putative FmdB family regulatory protein